MSNARELAELSGSYGTGGFVGMKNRIINGAMMIDQRNVGAAVTLSSGAGAIVLDRFYFQIIGSSAGTVNRYIGTISGVYGSFAVYSGAAGISSLALWQRIESSNSADLASSAVTLSAMVYQSSGSSVTPTAAIYRANATDNFSGVTLDATLTGSTAVPSGTWTKVIFSGTLTSSATTGLQAQINCNVGLGAGTQFIVTQVQLEKGTQATSFDFRPYGAELALCQRYYIKKTGVDGDNFNIGQVASATRGLFWEPWVMRSAPTINYANIVLNDVAVGPTVTGTAGITTFSSGISYALDAAGGGMTSGRACRIRSSASGYIDFSAEL